MNFEDLGIEILKNRLRFDNPHWATGDIGKYYSGMRPRFIVPLVWQQLQESSVLVLRGSARRGKTVLLRQLTQRALREQVPAQGVLYIDAQLPIYHNVGLENILNFYAAENHTAGFERPQYLLIDNAHYFKALLKALPGVLAQYPQMKVVMVSTLKEELGLEALGVPAVSEYHIPPVSFYEYMKYHGYDQLIQRDDTSDWGATCNDVESLNMHFMDYINYGGFLETAFSDYQRMELRNCLTHHTDISSMSGNLSALYGIQNPNELNNFFSMLIYYAGTDTSIEWLSQHSAIAKNTLKKYLAYLQAADLIHIIYRVDFNAKTFKRANFFKVYLNNPSVFTSYWGGLSLSSKNTPQMVENTLFTQWHLHEKLPIYYARREKGMIDAVGMWEDEKPEWVVDINFTVSLMESLHGLENVRLFCSNHRMREAVIATYEYKGRQETDGIQFEFIPSSLYCYLKGKEYQKGLF